MFDLGWSEMMVIAVLAVLVIGPKDLPKVLRTVGQWTGRARALAREFQSSLEDVAREAELDEIKKNVERATDFDIKREIENTIDPTGTLDGAFDVNPAVGDKSDDDKSEEAKGEAAPTAPPTTWSQAAAPAHSVNPPADETTEKTAREPATETLDAEGADTARAVKTGTGA